MMIDAIFAFARHRQGHRAGHNSSMIALKMAISGELKVPVFYVKRPLKEAYQSGMSSQSLTVTLFQKQPF